MASRGPVTSRNPETHVRAGCQNLARCTGPGCRVKTGKTAAKGKAKK